VQLSWVLTGERNSWKGVAPRHPYDREKRAYGAWIVGVRLSEIEIDDAAFPLFADAAKSARRARLASVGLSWNLVRGMRWMLDYDVTRFDGGASAGDRPDEKALLTRFQVAF
jgi:phosphate-selective porin OprO/OprP